MNPYEKGLMNLLPPDCQEVRQVRVERWETWARGNGTGHGHDGKAEQEGDDMAMRSKSDEQDEQKHIQAKLGCQGCKFANVKALATGRPCCTRPTLIHTDGSGKCLDRVEVQR